MVIIMRGFELIRLGRDSSLKQTNTGTSVCNLACAYDVGFGDNKKTQWIDVSVYGKQAENLAKYFVKGQQFLIYMRDIHVEEYTRNDGSTGSRLKAVADDIKFTGKKDDNIQPQQNQSPQQGYTGQTPAGVTNQPPP